MTQIYLSGPALAALRSTARMTENDHMRAGHYGRVLVHNRIAYVALDAVEKRVGCTFTPDQIALAVAGKPTRILKIQREEAA
jgi:hypothetical protein